MGVYEVTFLFTVSAENEDKAKENAIVKAWDDISREHIISVLDVTGEVFLDED